MLVRLRPIVHATPTETGLHVRGWSASFTVDGGTGLWKVWQRLAPHLAEGIPAAELTAPSGTAPAVAAALEVIITQLREHDMLVEVPADWGADAPPKEVANWLESVAADPARTWRRLRELTFTITGSGALAAAALRALTSAGLSADVIPAADLLVTAGEQAVAAGCVADAGYVVEPGPPDAVSADAAAIARRLGDAGGDAEPPEVLAALAGSAAVHRIVCAVGGLPDPSTEFTVPAEEPAPTHHYQAVLVARLDPLRATYHPWLSAARPVPPPADPLRTLEALVDPELGAIATPRTDALPQVPANLTFCGDVLGIGTTAEAARLDAAICALRAVTPPGVTAGIDRTHALGSALRQAIRRLPGGSPVSEEEWATDPTARRWWKALTLRFAVPATVEVTRLAPAAVRAEIRSPQGLLAWSVEAAPADAVALAALAATGYAQAGRTGMAHLNGAAPLAVAADQPSWVSREWHWPAGIRDGEPALQAGIAAVLPCPVEQVSLGPALDSAGLVAFTVPEPR